VSWIDLLEPRGTSFGRAMPDQSAVLEALADDLNTSLAIAELHKLAGLARTDDAAAQKLHTSLEFLGVLSPASLASRKKKELSAAAARLLDERTAARARRDFKESDRIRDELLTMGVVVKDGKDADGNPVTTWEVAR
jgi:cysteinyl-tRNA synthetase